MAIERGFFLTLEKLYNQAADALEAAAKLLREGSRTEAIAILNTASADITKGSEIEKLRLSVIGQLKGLGVEQAPILQTTIEQATLAPVASDLQSTNAAIVPGSTSQEEIVDTSVTQDKVKETKNPDFAFRQERVAHAFFTVEGEGDKPALWGHIINAAYSDILSNIENPEVRAKKEKQLSSSAVDIGHMLIEKLDRFSLTPDPEKTLPKIAAFVSYVRTRQGLECATIDDIKDVIARKFSLAVLRQKLRSAQSPEEEKSDADPRLTGSEIYLLAQTLRQLNIAKLQEAGIEIHSDDQKEIESIAGKLESPEISRTAAAKRDSLLAKLIMFLTNKQEAFLANMENEDAQFLLTILAKVKQEEQVRMLFDATKSEIGAKGSIEFK